MPVVSTPKSRLVTTDPLFEDRAIPDSSTLDASVKALVNAKYALLDLVGPHPAALAYVVTGGKIAEKSPLRLNPTAAKYLSLYSKDFERSWRALGKYVDPIFGKTELRKRWVEVAPKQIQNIKKIGFGKEHLIALADFVSDVSGGRWTPPAQIKKDDSVSIELRKLNRSCQSHYPIDLAPLRALKDNLLAVYDDALRKHEVLIRTTVQTLEWKHPAYSGELLTPVSLGFIDGFDNVDPCVERSVHFIRLKMRGKGFDQMRKLGAQDGFTRSLGVVEPQMRAAETFFVNASGRNPSSAELSEICYQLFSMRPSAMHLQQYAERRGGTIELDAPISIDSTGETANHSLIEDTSIEGPDNESAREEIYGLLRILVSELPEAERDTICTYFGLMGQDDRTLREVANERNLTESRICQIVAKATKGDIRERLLKVIGGEELALFKGGVVKDEKAAVRPAIVRDMVWQLSEYLKKGQIATSTPGIEDRLAELDPVLAPGIIRGIDQRREEQFARKLAAVLPITVHLNDEFYRWLPGKIQTQLRGVPYDEISFFIYSTNKILTGIDKRGNFSTGLAPRVLEMCWPLIEQVFEARGGVNLAHAFGAITAVHAVDQTFGRKREYPADGFELIESLLPRRHGEKNWSAAAQNLDAIRNIAIFGKRFGESPMTIRQDIKRIISRDQNRPKVSA